MTGTLSLLLGGFEMVDPAGSAYGVEVVAEGTHRGKPVPINVAVKSWLQDGAIVVTQGYDNRQVPVRVTFSGSDLATLADAEKALFAEMGKPNTLTWTPPDGFGPPSVFEVITSEFEQVYDGDYDLDEIRSTPERTYQINLTCQAFVRSVNEVVTAAPAPPPVGTPTVVVVNDGSSLTGWTASGSLTVVSGAITNSYIPAPGPNFPWMELNIAAVDMSATPYLQVDYWEGGNTQGVAPTLTADGVALEYVGSQVVGTFTRASFYCPDLSVATIRLTSYIYGPEFSFGNATKIDQVRRTDTIVTPGTRRELQRTLAVSGSVRTQGTLSIEHESDALGDVLAYTFKDTGNGYSPPLRQYRVSGGGGADDPSLVSGAYDMLDTSLVFDVPAISLAPGGYILMARVRSASGSGATTLSCSVKTRVNSTDLDTPVTWSAPVTLGATWEIRPLGRVMLPTRDLADASSGMIRLTVVDADTAGIDVYLDEAWLFNREIGSLVQVACGTGTPTSGGSSNRLWLLPPTVDAPRPRILRGHAVNQGDAFNPGSGVAAWSGHVFYPPTMAVFTVTTNAEDAAVSLRHSPSWHTHAAS